MESIELIVGLGNPGKDYEDTKHNAGAWWLEELLSQDHQQPKLESKFHGKIAAVKINNLNVRTLLPTTYMNESGRAVAATAKFYRIPPEKVLIVHDDLDLPAGSIKLKRGGGHGGHNGLRDIIPAIGSKEFARLRIGIGHPGNKNQVTNYVLKPPSKEDKASIMHAIAVSLDLKTDIITGNWSDAMNKLHEL